MDLLSALFEILALAMLESIAVPTFEVGTIFPVILPEAVIESVFPRAFVNEETCLVVVHALAVELPLLEIAQVFLTCFELKLPITPKQIIFGFERAFVLELFGRKFTILPGVGTVLAFVSEEGGSFLALSMHFSIVELAHIKVVRGKDEDSFNVRKVVFKVAVVSFFIRSLKLPVTLFEPVLDVSQVLFLGGF